MIHNLASKEGITVFLCTHQLRYAQEICTRYGLIEQGSLLALGTIAGQFTGVLLISPKCLIVKKLRLMISQAEFLINQLSRIVSQKSGMPLRAVLYSIRFRSAGWAAAAADLA